MRFVRVWLPVLIIVGGIVVIIATGGSETGVEGGAGIIGAGASVWLLNLIFRVGVQGERDRDAEDEARAFYAEHGYWPDEAPPPQEPPPEHPAHEHPHRHQPHGQPPHARHPPGRSAGPTRRPPRRP
jgi:hypothetical protein